MASKPESLKPLFISEFKLIQSWVSKYPSIQSLIGSQMLTFYHQRSSPTFMTRLMCLIVHVMSWSGNDSIVVYVQLEDEEVAKCPLLVLANKRDLPFAASLTNITHSLGLHHMSRPWHVQPTCATTSEGVYEALDWLAQKMAWALSRFTAHLACYVKWKFRHRME